MSAREGLDRLDPPSPRELAVAAAHLALLPRPLPPLPEALREKLLAAADRFRSRAEEDRPRPLGG